VAIFSLSSFLDNCLDTHSALSFSAPRGGKKGLSGRSRCNDLPQGQSLSSAFQRGDWPECPRKRPRAAQPSGGIGLPKGWRKKEQLFHRHVNISSTMVALPSAYFLDSQLLGNGIFPSLFLFLRRPTLASADPVFLLGGEGEGRARADASGHVVSGPPRAGELPAQVEVEIFPKRNRGFLRAKSDRMFFLPCIN